MWTSHLADNVHPSPNPNSAQCPTMLVLIFDIDIFRVDDFCGSTPTTTLLALLNSI
jgi:hypothetical protein